MTTSNDKLDCAQVLDLLDDYRRQTLSEAALRQVQQHLDSCEDCRAELRIREDLGDHLRAGVASNAAPVGLSPQVLREIAVQSRSTTTYPQRKSFLPTLLAAAMLVVIGVAFIRIQPGEQFSQTDTIAYNGEAAPEAAPAMAPVSEELASEPTTFGAMQAPAEIMSRNAESPQVADAPAPAAPAYIPPAPARDDAYMLASPAVEAESAPASEMSARVSSARSRQHTEGESEASYYMGVGKTSPATTPDSSAMAKRTLSANAAAPADSPQQAMRLGFAATTATDTATTPTTATLATTAPLTTTTFDRKTTR